MPEKALTVATYAAGASLATIALVYVFAPTFFLDSGGGGSGKPLSPLSSRKNGVVGLANAANDCFINSVLQALAGLGDLRIYLIRETHRRRIDDAGVYKTLVPADWPLVAAATPGSSATAPTTASPSPGRPIPRWKLEGLQAGLVTEGLKEILDQLNERPIYRKTISAVPFVRVLEVAFRQRISRQQQDAQEFLQVVAERLCDEYHAGRRAREYARKQAEAEALAEAGGDEAEAEALAEAGGDETKAKEDGSGHDALGEDGFPMEGQIESQIECQTCGFRPRPSGQTFCTLTLNVPQASSTSLSACFDMMLKTEYIDGFKCEKCRLVHAQQLLEAELARTTHDAEARSRAQQAVALLQAAIDTDPEKPPAGVALPDARFAPQRRIARHFRLVRFPKILAIHLSRSIFDTHGGGGSSLKNSAKVAFPETLPLGGLLHQRRYKLLCLVTHKGSHQSGHYESFRRQTVPPPPYANAHPFRVADVYQPVAGTTPASTPAGTPKTEPAKPNGGSDSPVSLSTMPELPPPPTPTASTSTSREARKSRDGNGDAGESGSIRSISRSTWSKLTSSSRSGSGSRSGSVKGRDREGENQSTAPQPPQKQQQQQQQQAPPPRRRKRTNDRWWRISDERVREASTREALGMQREVYLLFYELERDGGQ